MLQGRSVSSISEMFTALVARLRGFQSHCWSSGGILLEHEVAKRAGHSPA